MSEHAYPETAAFVRKMQADGQAPPVVDAFCELYRRYRQGDPGKLPWGEIAPPEPGDIVPFRELHQPEILRRGRDLMDQVVVISLNGGLGTTMKLDRAKSLITVRDGLSFLDLTGEQIVSERRALQVRIPWILMNSFHTRKDSLDALSGRGLEVEGLPLDFLQHRFPRIDRASSLPLKSPRDEDSWAPPGHGDIYLALWLSGLLRQLIDRGFRYAFVSNVDNLGSTPDARIPGFMDLEGAEFVMEVTAKTDADIKGGTLVRYLDRLMLLERSQVEAGHMLDFEDTSTFAVFNTNSLWWRLDRLLEKLEAGAMTLPMIVNPKVVGGVEVVQLETAMGAGIGGFERAVGVEVPRERFAPVKATWDLLAVRSDAYILDEAYGVRPSPARDPSLGPPVVTLDPRFYQGMADFEARFPHPPSMLGCRSLTVEGDLVFGERVTLTGDVVLKNDGARQRKVPDGAELTGVHRF